jgi:hypothetical protein
MVVPIVAALVFVVVVFANAQILYMLCGQKKNHHSLWLTAQLPVVYF